MFLFSSDGLRIVAIELFCTHALGNHFIYASPVRDTSHIAVVYKNISLYFSTEMAVVLYRFFRIIAIYRIKNNSLAFTPFNGFIKQTSFTYCPENKAMPVFYEFL